MEENKKKNNVLTIVLVGLLLVAFGVICYLLINNNNENNTDSGQNNNTVQEQENITNEEVNQDSQNTTTNEETPITPVSYSPKCVEDNQKSLLVDIDETKYNNIVDYINEQQNVEITLSYCNDDPLTDDIESGTYKFNDTEKSTVLNEIKNSRHYIENTELGGGGCVPTTEISYTRNNKSYYVNYWGYIMDSNDGNIYKIIDKTATTPSTQEYCHYFAENLGSTINNITKYER